MIWAQFEEKEYEAPLYNQLEAGHPHVWSPGQVFENRIGIDHGLWLIDLRFWRHIGYRAVRRGSVLAKYDWSFLSKPPQRSLPNFKMNLFIQSKRPQYAKRVKKQVRALGIDAPCYRMNLEPNQQRILGQIGKRLGQSSYVCYASPAFHTLEQLYLHTRQATIVDESTFPAAKNLLNHSSWYYAKGGSKGAANVEPELIDGNDLVAQISEILERNQRDESTWSENLAVLSEAIISTIAENTSSEDARSSSFKTQLNLIDRVTEGIEVGRNEVRHFMQIDLFAESYNVNWYTIG